MDNLEEIFNDLKLDIVDTVNPIGLILDEVFESIDNCKAEVIKHFNAKENDKRKA